jgi:hypothetical protein
MDLDITTQLGKEHRPTVWARVLNNIGTIVKIWGESSANFRQNEVAM